MKLSVIIPVYNIEPYIDVCIRSVIDQDINPNDYEIIIMDDGSEDNSLKIINELKLNNPQIRLIQQENMGNGGARNTGVNNALGEYIYFLDGDDYVAHNTLGTVLELAIENNLDLLGFDSQQVSDDQNNVILKKTQCQIDKIQDGLTFIAENEYRAEVWWYLIKSSFLKNVGLQFYDRKFIQDSYYTPTLILAAKRVSYVPFPIHRYRKSLNSITRTRNLAQFNQHMRDMLYSIKKLDDLIKSLNSDSETLASVKRRLQKNKQRYSFLLFTRIAKSDLNNYEIQVIKTELIRLGAYPIRNFNGPSYNKFIYYVLRVVFNRDFLFLPAKKIYRILIKTNLK